jgi:AmmeMemoRadiSam system protein A
VGDLSEDEVASAARKLAARLKQGDVIVASSDLTHYGEAYGYRPFPNDAQVAYKLRARAAGIFERIGSLETGQFDRYLAETRDNVCGRAPIRLLMAAMALWSEEVYLSPIDYMASGELGHDYSLSVGYGALAFYPASTFGVSAQNQEKLLASARRTLDGLVAAGRKQRDPVPAADRDAALDQRSSLFVTIRRNGELRGCIGTFVPRLPLFDGVADQTLAAAVEDPRFPAISAKEGPMSIEISVLTPLKRLGSWRDFRLGHGAVIDLDGRSGTLLPQVAGEMHWNREEFLENLSLKAGLPRKAYRDPHATLYVYSAQVFSEQTEPQPSPRAGGE